MKKLLLLLLLTLPLLSFSQTYDCEFLRYTNGHDDNPTEAEHYLNNTTTINYEDGDFTLKLETIFEDLEFSAYITIIRNGSELMEVNYWDSDFYPDFFIITYSLPSFDGECECKLRP